MKRKIIATLIAITLLFSICSFNVFANQPITVYLDNQLLQFDVTPQIIHGRTMVPMRVVFEKLGAEVSWDSCTNTAHAYNYDIMKGVSITIGASHMIDICMNVIQLDVPALVKNGRTLVPLRAISEAFGCDVQWDGATSSVKIFSNKVNINEKANNYIKTETIKMATNAEIQPYAYKEDNEFKGIDIDIAKEIAAELGMKLEIVDVGFDAIIPSVMQGEVDFGIAGMIITDERQTFVNFTVPYIKNSQVVIVDKSSDISHPDELDGRAIGTKTGTTAEAYLQSDYDSNVLLFYDYIDGVIELKSGSIDAVVVDDRNAQIILNENTELKALEPEYAFEEYAIVVSKDNAELLSKMNSIITKLIANGTIDTIVKKYEERRN